MPPIERILAHLDSYRRRSLGRPLGTAEKFFTNESMQQALFEARQQNKLQQQFRCSLTVDLDTKQRLLQRTLRRGRLHYDTYQIRATNIRALGETHGASESGGNGRCW